MVTVFFSYSHRDEDLRDELEIHLSALKRQGIIETWHDRRIGAGKDLDREIDKNVETADIILLLVSPYFIASDYCYDVEMKRALYRHERGDARVIPVILHPCDWQHTLFGKLRATPPDGKPVSKYPNQHDAFLAVVKDIRAVAEEMSGPRSLTKAESEEAISPTGHAAKTITRSSNLRVRRDFTDLEKSKFLRESLEYLANFFQNSLRELQARGTGIETEFGRIDTNQFTAAVYRSGKLMSRCRIWRATDNYSTGEIRYSSSQLSDGSWNESVSVQDDGYSLGLKSLGMWHRMPQTDSLLTQQGAAEYLWAMFIECLQ